MITRWPVAARCAAFAALVLTVVACAGGVAVPPAVPSPVAAIATAVTGVGAQACTLLTPGEIEDAVGSKASNGSPMDRRGESICTWTLESGVLDQLELTVTPTGGRDKFDLYANDYYEAPPEHVSGLGDDAVKTATIPGGYFYVVSDDVLLTFKFSLPLSVRDPYAVVHPLVETAVSRL